MTVDFIVDEGHFPDSVIYAGCAEFDDYVLGILQIVPEDDYSSEAKLREPWFRPSTTLIWIPTPNDEDDEPKKTATPKDDDQDEVDDVLDVFESREYDFAFAYDPTLHTVETTTLDNGAEFITVSSEDSLVFDIVVADMFEDDEACLAGILNVGISILEGVGIEGETSSDGTFLIEDGTHEGATAAEIDLTPSDDSNAPSLHLYRVRPRW